MKTSVGMLKSVMTIFPGGRETSCMVIKSNEEGGAGLGIGSLLLPSRAGVLEPRRCCALEGTFQDRVGLSAAVDAQDRVEVPGARCRLKLQERTRLLRTGTGFKPAAGRMGSLAGFPRMEYGKMFRLLTSHFLSLGKKRRKKKTMDLPISTEDKNSQTENPQTRNEILKKTSSFPVQAGADTCRGFYYGLPGVETVAFKVGWGRAGSGVLPVEEEIPAWGQGVLGHKSLVCSGVQWDCDLGLEHFTWDTSMKWESFCCSHQPHIPVKG